MKSIIFAAVLIGTLGNFAKADLPSGIYPISGIDENLPNDDLNPLAKMIGNSRVVGLGESFHTSGGYNQAKYRLIKYLVETMGFRAILMETPLRTAVPTKQYIEKCNGGIDQAMNGIMSVFAATSTQSLFEYLCQFNQSHPNDPVKFFGFDVQEIWYNYPALRNYLLKTAPDLANAELPSVEKCIGAKSNSPMEYYQDPIVQGANAQVPVVPPQGPHDECHAALNRVMDYMETHKTELIKKSTEREYFFIRIAVDSIGGQEDQIYYTAMKSPKAQASRDAAMAKNALALLAHELPNSKTIVWAHNGHIAMDTDAWVTAWNPNWHNVGMGTWMKKSLGSSYFPIGFIGYNVVINWPGNDYHPPIPTSLNSVEVILHGLNHSYLLLDSKNTLIRSGKSYDMEEVQEVPFDQYRALLYFDNTPGMTYWYEKSKSPGSP